MNWALPTKSPVIAISEVRTFFLEEDCDLSTFDRAMTKAGRPFELIEVYEPRHRESWVRLLWSYECEVQA